jgi:hypothetical protein
VLWYRREERRVVRAPGQKLGGAKGYIDSFIPGKLIVEAKSGGKNLDAAFDQASEYALALTEAERPRYVIVSDFQRFVLTDSSPQTRRVAL